MGIDLTGHKHLPTIIRLKVIHEFVLTEEWQTIRKMYPIFTRQMVMHSKIEPVLGNNFIKSLNKLVEEGKAEMKAVQEHNRQGVPSPKPTHYFRRKDGSL